MQVEHIYFKFQAKLQVLCGKIIAIDCQKYQLEYYYLQCQFSYCFFAQCEDQGYYPDTKLKSTSYDQRVTCKTMDPFQHDTISNQINLQISLY